MIKNMQTKFIQIGHVVYMNYACFNKFIIHIRP